MRKRSTSLLSVVVVSGLLAGTSACKDTEARDQLKKVKAELEDREDELADAEKKLKAAEKDLTEAKAKNEMTTASLDAAMKKQAELLERFKNCPESTGSAFPVPLGTFGAKCTAYFKFMDDCLPLMPSVAQSPMRDAVDQMKKSLASTGSFGVTAMEQGCEAALDAVSKMPQCASLPKPKPCNCDPKDPLCACW